MSNMSMNAIDQVSAALSTASLRNQVIAGNIANRDTADYQRMKVSFDQALSAAGGVDAAPGRVSVVPEDAGRTPSVEEDLVALSSNTMNYQALARALSRYFSIAQTIANGGRG